MQQRKLDFLLKTTPFAPHNMSWVVSMFLPQQHSLGPCVTLIGRAISFVAVSVS